MKSFIWFDRLWDRDREETKMVKQKLTWATSTKAMVVPTVPAPITLILSLLVDGEALLGATWVIKAFTVVVIILNEEIYKPTSWQLVQYWRIYNFCLICFVQRSLKVLSIYFNTCDYRWRISCELYEHTLDIKNTLNSFCVVFYTNNGHFTVIALNFSQNLQKVFY